METTEVEWVEVQIWSELAQREHGDCLGGDFVSTLPERVNLDLQQNDTSKLKDIWGHMSSEAKNRFYEKYAQIASLLFVEIDNQLIRAAMQFWDPSYRCFTFNQLDLTPTIEEYLTLLGVEDYEKIYIRRQKPPTIRKNLATIFGVKGEELEKYLRKKGELEQDHLKGEFLYKLVEEHPTDDLGLAAFALAIYGLVIFPKSLGYVDSAVIDLFERVSNQKSPVPAIVAETIRSLSYCRVKGRGRFICCAPLLSIWLKSHLDKKDPETIQTYRGKHPIQEFCKAKWIKAEEKRDWVTFLQRLSSRQVEWMAPWMKKVRALYSCGDMPWVPLLGIWGAVAYSPLMVLRQYGVKQFMPATHALKDKDFDYSDGNPRRGIEEILKMWDNRKKIISGPVRYLVTVSYEGWRSKLVKDSLASQEKLPEPIPIHTLEPPASAVDLLRKELEDQKREWEKERSKLEREKFDLELEITLQKGHVSSAEKKRDEFKEGYKRYKEECEQLKKRKAAQSLISERKELEGKRAIEERWMKRVKQEQQSKLALERKCTRLEREILKKEKEQDDLRAQCTAEKEELMAEYEELQAKYIDKLQEVADYFESKFMEGALKGEIKRLEKLLEQQKQAMNEFAKEANDDKRNMVHRIQQLEAFYIRSFNQVEFCNAKLREAGMASLGMLDEIEELMKIITPLERSGQRMLRFLSCARKHYEFVSKFVE